MSNGTSFSNASPWDTSNGNLTPISDTVVHIAPSLGFALTRLVGLLLRDVVLTRDEVDGLMAGLLTSDAAPAGTTRLGEWLAGNADALGRQYVSEFRRNYRR